MRQSTINKIIRNLGFRPNTEPTNATAIFPWLAMDVTYSIFMDYINKLPLAHMPKRLRTQWKETLTRIYRRFFDNLNEDEACELTDLMDDLETYLYNDIVMLRVKLMEAVDHKSTEVKKSIANGYICCVMSEVASSVYRIVYKKHVKVYDGLVEITENPEMESAFKTGMRWTGYYALSHGIEKVVCEDKIADMRDILIQKSIRWAKRQHMEK